MSGENQAGMWVGGGRRRKDAARTEVLQAGGWLDVLPSDTEDPTPVQSARLDQCVDAMRATPLFGSKTPRDQVRHSIRALVGQYRKRQQVPA